MNPDPEAEALSRYREALAAGAPEGELARLEAGLDAELAATVRWSMTRGRQARPQPDPAFVRDLRRELVQAASASAPPSLSTPVSTPTIAEGNHASSLLPFRRERAEPPTIVRPRWAWTQLAAAVVLLFAVAGGLLLLRSVGTERAPTVFVAPGAPETVTFVDATVQGAPDAYTPLTLDRWTFQPGGTLAIPPLDGPQWAVAETGPLVATVDGEPRSLAIGQSLVVPAGHTLELRNPELTSVSALRGVANSGFALEEYDRGVVGKTSVLETAAHPTLPPGQSRIVFDQLTIPPGTVLRADAATGQDWFHIDQGLLGLTLAGDDLPVGWTSGQERELAAGDVIPRLTPGTHLTMHNIGEEALVLLRLRVEPSAAAAIPAAGAAMAGSPLRLNGDKS